MSSFNHILVYITRQVFNSPFLSFFDFFLYITIWMFSIPCLHVTLLNYIIASSVFFNQHVLKPGTPEHPEARRLVYG